MKNTVIKLNGQRIGIFGRGGCGKSTTTVFLAQALRKAGYPVVVLDADSTNEGLAIALGAARAPDDLLEWLGGTVFSGGPVTCPVDDPMPQAGARVHLRDLPGRFFSRTPDGILVLNKVADPDTEHQLWQLLVQAGIQPVASFGDEPSLRRAWLESRPLESRSARSEAEKIVRALEDGRGRFVKPDDQQV